MKMIFAALGAPFLKLPFCSLPGAFVGAFSGFLFSLFLQEPMALVTVAQLFAIGAMIGATGFLLVLLVFGVVLRFGAGRIFWPALVNALITAVITVFVLHVMPLPAAGGLIGMAIGIAVGALLCRFCYPRSVLRNATT